MLCCDGACTVYEGDDVVSWDGVVTCVVQLPTAILPTLMHSNWLVWLTLKVVMILTSSFIFPSLFSLLISSCLVTNFVLGERTLGVITKLDLMDQGTNAVDILSGYDRPSKGAKTCAKIIGEQESDTIETGLHCGRKSLPKGVVKAKIKGHDDE